MKAKKIDKIIVLHAPEHKGKSHTIKKVIGLLGYIKETKSLNGGDILLAIAIVVKGKKKVYGFSSAGDEKMKMKDVIKKLLSLEKKYDTVVVASHRNEKNLKYHEFLLSISKKVVYVEKTIENTKQAQETANNKDARKIYKML